ncbi:FkbM family methyltransferase, partial [Candidatus Pelagibacter sp.]|nr:FkbM family methyltransferase [Candidatus Pelagibacter sp.]
FMIKKIKTMFAMYLAKKIINFRGKDRLIRYLASPDVPLDSGNEFITNYHGFRYQGITSNFIDWGVYFKDGHEKALIRYFKTEISKFEYFIDIGSNSGSVSLPFAKYKQLKIICFEPLKYNFKKLLNNFKINNILKDNEFYNIALSDCEGKDYIYYSKEDCNVGASSLEKEWRVINTSKEEIKKKRLDDILNFSKKKILIKIDVEGHEEKVINGALNLLLNNHILMYLETNNKNLLKKLESLNFKSYPFEYSENNYKFTDKMKGPHIILKNF